MRFCADIGGSFTTVALLRGQREILNRRRIATPTCDLAALTELLVAYQRDHATDLAPGTPLCLALAGFIDPKDGEVFCANIPALHGRPLAAELSAALGRPVALTNDADSFALAEARLGAGRGHDAVFGVILGTGVGGGLVLGGRLVGGEGGVAGEWGHGPVIARSGAGQAATPYFACGCGQSGCLNTVGGARGLERLHAFLHGSAAVSSEITAQWEAGEATARDTLSLYLDLLSGPLAMLSNTLGLTVIPVGGGLAACGPLVEALDLAVRTRMLRAPARPLLVRATLGSDAGLLGAVLAAEA